ncbi:MAG TPA: hypothetical protein VNQ99_07240 [Xanthobacteraceae bacterium]|nr:hypothetical protein [Xanthobacteraceae bacterium]
MRKTWKTKYGTRRVRHDPPTLDEAVIAASGMTDDTEAQVAIAASLMDLSADKVRPAVLKAAALRRNTETVTFAGRPGAPRAVVVERKTPRRFAVASSSGAYAR